MKDSKYFNFPIQLIQGLFENKIKTLNDIMNYAIYAYTLKLNEVDKMVKLNCALNYYGVEFHGTTDKKKRLVKGEELYKSLQSPPKVGLSLPVFWDFYDNEKNDFDLACLAAFLAIKSILGTKSYCKITNTFLWSRMSGRAKAIDNYWMLNESVIKYANEYQTVKIKRALRDSWGLVNYGHYTRGFYVSFTLSLDALVFEVEKRRKTTKDKIYKQAEKEAISKALERLRNNN